MTNSKNSIGSKGYTRSKRLLGVSADAKTRKGASLGILTGILYFAPSTISGIILASGRLLNICAFAGKCLAPCLFTAGRGAMRSVDVARVSKTRFWHYENALFLATLRKNVAALVRKAQRLGMTPAIRLNGTSDLPKLGMQLASEFPEIQFYDYTKIPEPWARIMPNYHLTFSYNGDDNWSDCLAAIDHGVNVAVVFRNCKKTGFPQFWRGIPVISGDETDARFLDPRQNDGRGLIVALHAKGKAKKDFGGFVVDL